jgi:mono/diheme cytochrome c family protein
MKYMIGAIIAIVLIIIGLLFFLYSGVYNISAADRHTGTTMWMINTLKENSVKNYADEEIQIPDLSDTSLVNRGFNQYKEMCVGCHGAPGVEILAKGFYPAPPPLTKAAGKWNPRELFWILKNGIKMSAMPSFGVHLSDEMIWSVTAFTQKLPNMTPEQYQDYLKMSPAPTE